MLIRGPTIPCHWPRRRGGPKHIGQGFPGDSLPSGSEKTREIAYLRRCLALLQRRKGAYSVPPEPVGKPVRPRWCLGGIPDPHIGVRHGRNKRRWVSNHIRPPEARVLLSRLQIGPAREKHVPAPGGSSSSCALGRCVWHSPVTVLDLRNPVGLSCSESMTNVAMAAKLLSWFSSSSQRTTLGTSKGGVPHTSSRGLRT